MKEIILPPQMSFSLEQSVKFNTPDVKNTFKVGTKVSLFTNQTKEVVKVLFAFSRGLWPETQPAQFL